MAEQPRDLPTQRLQPYRSGERLKARKLNRGVRAINQLAGAIQPPRQTVSQPTLPAPNAGTAVRQMEVIEVGGDFLVCQPRDFVAASGATVFVAKPWLLRRSPFEDQTRDGITFTYTSDSERTADDGADTETQQVTPSYVAGDVIYAARNINGRILIQDSQSETIQAAWLDLNVDGRTWAST